jgi:1-acyl-sn-glycerol-3-phosphate acyltransferase
VHITGEENIPKDAPFLLCSNHPNAFMDAIVLGMSVKRRTWFLVRSDVFRSKLSAALFEFIGMLPIYRLQEGVENLSKNDETFARCTRILEKKGGIIIFSEGLCIQERRIRKLRKGTARIAFTAEQANDFNLGLQVVPVGINYSATPWKFRSTVHLRFGEAFPVTAYQEVWDESQSKAINQFTRDLEQRMVQELVIIEKPENDQLVARLEEMFLKDFAKRKGLNPKNQKETHGISVQIANQINQLTDQSPDRVHQLRDAVSSYFEKLKKFDIRDWNLKENSSDNQRKRNPLLDALFFFLGFPFWLFGLITNYIPYKIPYLITQRVVQNLEWHASINVTVGSFLWLIFWGLESLFVALYFKNGFLLIAFMFIMPLCGVFAQHYWTQIKKSGGRTNFLRALRSQPDEIEDLFKLRSTIEKSLSLNV